MYNKGITTGVRNTCIFVRVPTVKRKYQTPRETYSIYRSLLLASLKFAINQYLKSNIIQIVSSRLVHLPGGCLIFARHKCDFQSLHSSHVAGTIDSFSYGKKCSNAKRFYCSCHATQLLGKSSSYLFFNNSNISNVEYYNAWRARKTTFNPMFFRYLKDKLIDSYITSLPQKFSLTVSK